MQNPLKKVNLAHYWQKSFVKWAVAIVALLIIVYGVVGFLVLPGILRDKAQEFVYGKFERTLVLSDVSFNPFTLAVEIDGLQLSEHGRDEPFLTFDHLTLNVSAQSIFRMAPVIEEIRLINPTVRLVRTENHIITISTISWPLPWNPKRTIHRHVFPSTTSRSKMRRSNLTIGRKTNGM